MAIKIGDKEFKYKKDALFFYKTILNSYKFGDTLTNFDFELVSNLLKYSKRNREQSHLGIKQIKIGKVQYNTKCFEILFDDDSKHMFSYKLAISGKRTPLAKFTVACRNTIQEDLHTVKQNFFQLHSKKGKVKCQETGIESSWIELNVDHRQPNTLSIIIDRFIELNKIDVNKVKYNKDNNNLILFSDKDLENNFRVYHKRKANLRIVRKEKNLSRTHQGRIKTQKKDLRI